MRGLDTNILLRYITRDDPQQARTALALFEHAEAGADRLHVSTITVCEMVWSLKTSYRMKRDEICQALETILALGFLQVQDFDLVSLALENYRRGPADFPDYLIGWQDRRAGCQDTVTFDRGLGGEEGFTLLR